MVETNTPVLTLVIKSIESEGVTKLEEEVQELVGTLSMLCSFLSVKDFCSFIFSEKFKQLTMQELEIVFEVGIYSRHEITLQLSASVDGVILNDLIGQNCFENDLVICSTMDDLEAIIVSWLTNF
ncbi:MAG TPA: hypothetical protein HA359_03410 [Candidatus Poseidoniaceae archaeon]|nr:MAG TPA: hypothetical protein D7H84_03415 [Candidatus Poseidoniales archaeon]DAC59162.1 MAG TPA: hypothetical protein D7I03_04525 [Candidatus Poseidoniales archaeon]HII23285.1 hypothetical protein [Candidatus Poseidoniaceae archaeon]HII50585.1 hypothetical protein [Candidatus Poseidoniaceae archaeon]